jgi:hypothetical protein
MDFASLILFLVLYYIRPHEWIGIVADLRPVTLTMAVALIAMFTRHRGLTWRDLFKTPHDYVVLIYCAWIVLTSPDISTTFSSVYPLYIFYVVTVQALSNINRIRSFLTWWAIMIFMLAAMAVLSQYGFDPTGANDITQGKMKGRLILNTWLFNNPNALGHSVVPGVLMFYFLFIWKRPIFVRIGALPLFAVPLYCIYLTFSKGAFLAGFATAVAALTFGRPRVAQGLIILAAFTTGWAGIKSLPRMQELESAQSDQAIQGRLAAFNFGLSKVKSAWTGIGHEQFVHQMTRETGIRKASHSSYVQIGTELGKPGLFLFLGIFYCCLRTLLTAQTRTTEEERARRILFTLVISFLISSWMVDFAYRATYFLFAGAVAALHRLLLVKPNAVEDDTETVQEALTSVPALPLSPLQPATAAIGAPLNQTTVQQTTITIPAGPASFKDDEEEEPNWIGVVWNKITWKDVVIVMCCTYAVIRFWGYIMLHI